MYLSKNTWWNKKYVQPNSSDNCIYLNNVEILNLFDPELQLKDLESPIKNKLKELLSKLKTFKGQTVLVFEMIIKYFHMCSKLIAIDSDINKAFIFMHQNIWQKWKSMLMKFGLSWMKLWNIV